MKYLFFSHSWKLDNLNRNNHSRVKELAKNMKKFGWNIWIDEENLKGNIDADMVSGIDNSQVIIICLSESYFNKVNNTSNDLKLRDNCLKEWTYCNFRKKMLIPIIMEPNMLNPDNWPSGVIQLYLGTSFFVDASNDLQHAARSLNRVLLANGLKTNNLRKPLIRYKSYNSFLSKNKYFRQYSRIIRI